jgi:polar amino acid transport system substrate-binding protein
MKKFYKLLTVALALILAVSLTACGASTPAQQAGTEAETQEAVYRTLDEIKESGTVNIGVFSDKNPFGYVDENGEY